MKTLLAVMMLVLVGSVCHAQETKKTEYAVSVDTTKVNMGQQVDEVADALKKHLDGPMGIYYQVSVKRWMMCGISLMLVGAIAFVMGLGLCTCAKNSPRKSEYDDKAGWWISGVICIVGSLITFPIGLVYCTCSQYYALNDIITKIGQIVH